MFTVIQRVLAQLIHTYALFFQMIYMNIQIFHFKISISFFFFSLPKNFKAKQDGRRKLTLQNIKKTHNTV